jgi:intracellular multiplication protein IcmB
MVGFFGHLYSAFNRLSHGLFALLKGPVGSYCRLETADDPVTLAADDGSLISAFDISGALALAAEEDLELITGIISEKTAVLLEKPGHSLSLVFEYDPNGAAAELKENLRPSRVTARECSLSLDKILDGWTSSLAQVCGSESFLLVLWTRPELLPDLERRRAAAETLARLSPPIRGRQTEERGLSALRSAHHGARELLKTALNGAGLSARVMTAHELVRRIRRGLDPSLTAQDFMPLLPGDPRPFSLPDPEAAPLAGLLYPSLAEQIFPGEGRVIDRSLILVGQRLHAPFLMALPPRSPRPFSELFRVLATGRERDPLRLCLTVTPDGLAGLKLKGALAGILSFSSKDNKALGAALAALKKLSEKGETVAGLTMTFDTFIDLAGPSSGRSPEDLPGAVRLLRRRLARLSRAVSGWGQGQVQEVWGDPLLGLCASLPAMMPQGGPAPKAAAPLGAIWSFLPVRPASPWSAGPLNLRTPDGKIMPFAPISSVQSAWIDLGLAPMGGGKSVLLNTINLAFCLQGGLVDLPWVSIIDVGPSSSGLISLLKNALPPALKHLAVHHRLKMDPAQSVNPFDTPLGCRRPLPSQLSFLVNFLGLLATPLDKKAPPSGADGVIRQAVTAAYIELADKPKKLVRALDPDLFDLAESLGFPMDERSSYWELVDFFFENDLIHEAHLAQRLAVPTHPDVTAQVRNQAGLKAAYNFRIEGTGEHILDYVWRVLTEAVAQYRFLARPTRFSLTEARIVSLDLDEVSARGGGAAGDRQTAVMYLLARHLVGARFFLTPSDIPLMPEAYRPYHEKIISDLRRAPKRLCYDELHRVTGLKALSAQLTSDLETSARESRKWNLSIGLYSQSWEDFPPIIMELATSVFLLGSGTSRGREELTRIFGLNQTTARALERLGKPTGQGADLIALFRTAKGTSQQILTNTVSPALLWAFSTTSEDMTVRDALYDSHGVEKTLPLLAELFPGGVKTEVERLKNQRRFENPYAGKEDVLSLLISQLKTRLESQKD